MGRTGRSAVAAACVMGAILAAPVSAMAAQRYASPTGSGGACTQAIPCAIGTAVSSPPGDEVIILPGTYTVSGPLHAANQHDIHGLDGQPRPRILSTYGTQALTLGGAGSSLRHVEIETTGIGGVLLAGANQVLEDVVVNATGATGRGCEPLATGGGIITIRNSICRGTNRGLGVSCGGCDQVVNVRNVTAIGGTYGIAFDGTIDQTVNVTNTIARHTGGSGFDVRAAVDQTNNDVAINLTYSNYATREEVLCATLPCTATVTDPATMNNQTAAPVFVNTAAGDFHQAPSSPTVEAGIDNAANGTADIDGQQRAINTSNAGANDTDIGADELGRATSSAVSCSPATTPTASFVTCTATVTDQGLLPLAASTAPVNFNTDSAGGFSSGSCALVPSGNPGQSSCSVSYLPSQGGAHQITAVSSKDLTHDGGQAAFGLLVLAPPVPPTTLTPATTTPTVTPRKKCKRKRRGAAAAKKCKRR